MSSHSKQRNVVRYDELRAGLKFLECWILPRDIPTTRVRHMIRGRKKPNSPDPSGWTSVQPSEATTPEFSDDKIRQDIACLLKVQESIATFVLERTIKMRCPPPMLGSRMIKDGRMLLRAFHATSYCKYIPEVGITCSDLAHCQPYTSFKQLQDSAELSLDKLQNHCGGASFTKFISSSDDPDWLCTYIEKVWPKVEGAFESGQIAFIDVDILNSLGILFGRSDQLAAMVNATLWRSQTEPNGLHFIHPLHWIIYGWIPPQAIRRVIGVKEFVTLCNTNNQPVFYRSPEELLVLGD